MAITPDTKDWTWILERPCADCGFDAGTFTRADVRSMVRGNAAAWQRVLAGSAVRTRPSREMWSPLEYGCHVRDVFRIMTTRVDLLLAEDDPMFANWDQDETAVSDAYDTQDPARVAAELTDAAAAFGDRFSGLTDEQWVRPGRRSNGSNFTVDGLARYALHDVSHHLVDVPTVA
jgi:hypothetical protein